MADEKPTLHIDNDWKRQAQEEKKRLVEEESKKAAQTPLNAPSAASVGAGPAAAAGRAGRRPGEAMPTASFSSLVQSLLTQTLFYLGDLATRGNEPAINLDMARHQLDSLGVLEEKTKNNLTEEEAKLMDAALYESRARFVSVASQFIS